MSNSAEIVLKINDLHKSFGGIKAINGLSFELRRNEILGLLGPNGSGKTTLFNLITGVYAADSGTVEFMGRDITNLASHKVTLLGISRTFQSTKIFHSQSVRDNIYTAMIARARKKKALSHVDDKIDEALKFAKLIEHKYDTAGDLTHAQQRRLMVAMAVVEEPVILMLDEITAGMSGEECNEMIAMCRKVKEKGITILMIEHNMRVTMALSERIVALNFGQKIAEGNPEETTADPLVLEAYLGRKH